ncbi:sugar ABC transporter permease [Paenibacillus algorifonticola]|uniref:ABC transporter permease n=1 Tax=Paenibacillus sp. BIHB 4019 TaxID=1870819 RepID=A0A1B2DDV4_9BACL|nr:sugar ABC transporter permease [Paenibacillus sp. BIHB 4019]ANY65897.1 ABC transporter permease [Paenibacillus sp. BIHB 4019]
MEAVTEKLSTPRKKMSRQKATYLVAYLFLLPWLIGFFAFTFWPFINSLYLSFTQATLTSTTFIGLQNYIEMFQDPRFLKSIEVTTKYVVMSVPLKLAMALAVAMLLFKGSRSMSIYRTLFYLPSLIGGSIAVAVMWRKIFGLDGLWNSFLSLFGIPGKEWLGQPDYALFLLVLLVVWQFGSSMVIFLAGLKNVPTELYEASKIDGANAVRRFFKITLPIISPIMLFNLVLQTIGSFQVFTQGYVITKGGPIDETLFSVLYIYELAFQQQRMGYASAISWMLLVLIAVVTAIIFMTSKKWVFYESETKGGK